MDFRNLIKFIVEECIANCNSKYVDLRINLFTLGCKDLLTNKCNSGILLVGDPTPEILRH